MELTQPSGRLEALIRRAGFDLDLAAIWRQYPEISAAGRYGELLGDKVDKVGEYSLVQVAMASDRAEIIAIQRLRVNRLLDNEPEVVAGAEQKEEFLSTNCLVLTWKLRINELSEMQQLSNTAKLSA